MTVKMSHCTPHEEVASEYGRGVKKIEYCLDRFDLRWEPGYDVAWAACCPEHVVQKAQLCQKGWIGIASAFLQVTSQAENLWLMKVYYRSKT